MVASAAAEVTADVAALLDALLAAGFAVRIRRTPVETVAVDVRGLDRDGMGVTAHGCGVTVADALRDVRRYLPEVPAQTARHCLPEDN